MMLEIALEADAEWDSSRRGGDAWEKLARAAAEAAIAESAFPQLTTSGRPVELSIRLAGDDEVRALNAKWRGTDKATNVLSFPLANDDDLQDTSILDRELLLGDIILARGICEAEATEKGVSVQDHATHLLVHGTLHLLGYDHHDDAEAAEMEAREVRALARLGISDPYAVKD
jgi:probable rRNA maturation factor